MKLCTHYLAQEDACLRDVCTLYNHGQQSKYNYTIM